MRTGLLRLRSFRRERHGSVPVQYALVAAGTALVAVTIAQIAAGKIAEKFSAVSSALTKTQF
jgi:Flp pilus assembly pilin Flp